MVFLVCCLVLPIVFVLVCSMMYSHHLKTNPYARQKATFRLQNTETKRAVVSSKGGSAADAFADAFAKLERAALSSKNPEVIQKNVIYMQRSCRDFSARYPKFDITPYTRRTDRARRHIDSVRQQEQEQAHQQVLARQQRAQEAEQRKNQRAREKQYAELEKKVQRVQQILGELPASADTAAYIKNLRSANKMLEKVKADSMYYPSEHRTMLEKMNFATGKGLALYIQAAYDAIMSTLLAPIDLAQYRKDLDTIFVSVGQAEDLLSDSVISLAAELKKKSCTGATR